MTATILCRICGKEHPRGLGGTAMGRIFGLVPKTNAVDVYHALTRPAQEEDAEAKESIHTLRGHALEDMARDHFWARTGWRGRATRDVSTHPDFPAFQCHTDFEIFADAGRTWEGLPAPEWMLGPGVGETKCPSSGVVQRMLDEGLRQSEMLQAYTYAAVKRRRWACFNFFTMEHEAGPCIPVPIQLPEKMGAFLLESGQRFWDEHVVPRVPPDPAEWALMAKEGMPPLPELGGDRLDVEDEGVRELAKQTLAAHDLFDEADRLYREKKRGLEAALLALGHQRVAIEGAGNFSIVQKAGTVSFSRDSLALARPLDWDLVRDAIGRLVPRFSPSEVDETLLGLQLDLARFERVGDPSQYLLLPRRPKDG